MRKAILLTPILIFIVCACSDGSQQIFDRMSQKIDSLEKVNATRQADYENLNTFITTLSEGLDSIAEQENVLFYTNKGKERTIVDRKQLKKNLEMFQSTLNNQRQRITQLTDSLKKRGTNIARLNSIINYLNQQLDQKDQMIKILQADLNKKDVNIVQLNDRISTLAESNYDLTNKVDMQKQELSEKDVVINTAYVKMGSKKELMDAGFLSGGFLKKTKVNYHNLSKEKFREVDIRQFTEMIIPSPKPKVLSQMPASSYEIVNDGSGNTILRIKDPNSFWSISNYLIIQIN